ncbi:hypothetical protein B7H23_02015 [Notoacmeibacter marinus]|uniref:Lysozyme inhibitor LprI N-terminal domain-containing protein n=1 Tax=Notoacmeibacter marinus TaxID=1876515 RepID=A0A231V0M1_9HYPH|nr:hypothetical protein [Notoacmeibacter marinus]OXT01759.1 hypothetical protein B7H23_02015 [Notoacmeibacter marinus]
MRLAIGFLTAIAMAASAANAREAIKPSLSDAGILAYWKLECQARSDLVVKADVEQSLKALMDRSIDAMDPSEVDSKFRSGAWQLLLAGPQRSCPIIAGLYGPDGTYKSGWLELNAKKAAWLRAAASPIKSKKPDQQSTRPKVQRQSEENEKACASMTKFLAAGDRLLTKLLADERVWIRLGSEYHASFLELQNLAAKAMAATWKAHWISIDSWFPAMGSINSYANNDFRRAMSPRVLANFITTQPDRYGLSSQALQRMAAENAWIPGEFLKNCEHSEKRP